MLLPDVPLALTFDDVLLVPRHSEVLPRDVALSVKLGALTLHTPTLAAAMDTVTEGGMAIAMARQGALGVIHKNLSIEGQAAEVAKVKRASVDGPRASQLGTAAVDTQGRLLVAAAVGVGSEADGRVAALVEAGVDALFLDSAHGHSAGVLRTTTAIKTTWPHITVIAGNVATAEGTRACIEAGADAVKVGIGPGSICTTRIVAGTGVPQLTAVAQCAEAAGDVPVIADGGMRTSGDVAKAIAAGATVVMLGSMLAGTDEAPGDILDSNGRRMKVYRGMGSVEAMAAGSSDRYFQSDKTADEEPKKKLVPEGVVGMVPAKGPVGDVLYQLVGGLRAAMGYSGCADIAAMQRDARFVRITPAGLSESHVHDLANVQQAPNYGGRR